MEFRDKPMENLMRLQEKDICKMLTPCCWRASRSWAHTRRCVIRWCSPATASLWWICRGHGHAAAAFCAALPQGAALWHPDGGFWRSAAGVPVDSLLCGRSRGQVWLYWPEGPVSGGKRHQRPHPVRKIMNRSRCTRVCAAAFFTHFCGWLYTKRMKI